MSKVSFGVVLLDQNNRLLMAHATGCEYWDLPKGGGEPGEAPVISALRELQEETGIVLTADELEDLGQRKYYVGKDLHLFLARTDSTQHPAEQCVCTSQFWHSGRKEMIFEMDDFVWASTEQLPDLCRQHLLDVLRSVPEVGLQ